jgi:hypothetical protein
MTGPRARALGAAAVSLTAAWGIADCDAHPIDAVVWVGSPDALSQDDAGSPDGASASNLVWPNSAHSANSDPWISQHHDEIAVMHPKVLILNFANTFYDPTGTIEPVGYDIDGVIGLLVQQHIDAFSLASEYRGYKDPAAPPFLQYQIYKPNPTTPPLAPASPSYGIVDLRDNSGYVNSLNLPVTSGCTTAPPVPSAACGVDYGQLNSPSFAKLIGSVDPNDPSGPNLTLSELFEKGIINEVWGIAADPLNAGDPATVKFTPYAETKQAYDLNDNPVAGQLTCTTSPCAEGVSCYPCIKQVVPCKVTTRFYDFNPGRGAGCQLFDTGLVFQDYLTAGVLPAFVNVARTFFNFDFNTRFDAGFQSFFGTCSSQSPPDAGACIEWPSEANAVSGPASQQRFNFEPMSAGCGTVIFPPNATGWSTQTGDLTVLTSCENYGLHNGSGGADLTTPYSNDAAASDYAGNLFAPSDCGGTQPTYLLSSMPGYGTTAKATDGTPMKNWWVYLFY